ncbi:hypothetical protein RSSM_02165 [Rhodopirellula sallentina SM41]|uniref:Uncharacterized protein n=1 Tax=Rhodopirellula sallentina SM41 TaxID=1263870 RepID=M5U4J1_9BACT|nr:hypothetical protein RSSM_02165 [Rhodopirellula sallentina SM41]
MKGEHVDFLENFVAIRLTTLFQDIASKKLSAVIGNNASTNEAAVNGTGRTSNVRNRDRR